MWAAQSKTAPSPRERTGVSGEECSGKTKDVSEPFHFSAEILEARREWDDMVKVLKENSIQEHFNRQGCPSEVRARIKIKISQTNKSLVGSPSPDLFYKKC